MLGRRRQPRRVGAVAVVEARVGERREGAVAGEHGARQPVGGRVTPLHGGEVAGASLQAAQFAAASPAAASTSPQPAQPGEAQPEL